jgi:NTP pyrophosphatase (non-canonical NTP hydrolase)
MTTLNELAAAIYDNASRHGFWDDERNFGEMVALMHSELSEALEEHRADRPACYSGQCGKPEGVAVELVDCLIRILDTLCSLDVDVDAIVAEKMAYNASRPIKHGKAY